ncbi:MAG: hypothetical protein L0287_05715 [Anaerolineae bacterium]|nr:hypothetical protein [Anaerolineae bacterium]
MQNKKRYITLGIAVLLIGIAAFVAGRMINSNVGNVRLGGPNIIQEPGISSNIVTPAPELPLTPAEITGLFIERKDNTIIVQALSSGSSIGGIAGGDTTITLGENSGIRVEIVVTGLTLIYKDVTQHPAPGSGEIPYLQQAAEEGTLDDLNSETFITVWGRRSGDRIIADVIFYSDPRSLKTP